MKTQVTVNQAINKGKLITILLPALVSIITFAIIASTAKFSKPVLAVTFISAFIAGFICRSFTITYWKIWAYENVINVHSFRRSALTEKLMAAEDSFWAKTEIRTASQKAKLRILEQRFLHDDAYITDETVPDATYIYVSKAKAWIEISLGMVSIVAGLLFYFLSEDQKDQRISYVGIPLGLFITYSAYKKLKNIKPVIILDDEGIRLKDKGLIRWEYINGYYISYSSNGHQLDIEHTNGYENVETTPLSIHPTKLEHLIDTYRVRHAKNNLSVQ